MRRVLFGLAVLLALLATLVALWALRRPWAPQTSFDIIGVLWLMQNLPKLFALALAALLGGLALYMAVKGSRASPVGYGYDLESEGARVLSDPRFHGVLRHHVRAPADGTEETPDGTAGGEGP